ncbi:hypothetical protein TIFTF001_026114 [Ficus carica]|uniref:Uncharacterized protein n=1 Tax=Ficus carica TaxID=3494 RepID=A0AA88B1T4_FICCA|nr:hypothetical protein TIFTF001_026114 [Ficus carica]
MSVSYNNFLKKRKILLLLERGERERAAADASPAPPPHELVPVAFPVDGATAFTVLPLRRQFGVSN